MKAFGYQHMTIMMKVHIKRETHLPLSIHLQVQVVQQHLHLFQLQHLVELQAHPPEGSVRGVHQEKGREALANTPHLPAQQVQGETVPVKVSLEQVAHRDLLLDQGREALVKI